MQTTSTPIPCSLKRKDPNSVLTRMASTHAHIVVVPIPIHGHINPLLQLSVQLASMGHKLTFITTSTTQAATLSVLRSIVVATAAAAAAEDIDIIGERVSFRALSDVGAGPYAFGESIHFIESKAQEVGQLVESAVHELGPVSLAIVDFLVTRALKGVSVMRGVPVAAFFTSSAAMMHIVVNIRTLLEGGYVPCSKNSPQIVDSRVLPGIPELCPYSDLPEDPLDPSFKSMCMVGPALLEASWVLINTFHELEQVTLCAIRDMGFDLVTVGPLLQPTPEIPSSSSTLGHEILTWLSGHPPSSVLYVSFGTMVQLSDEQIEEIALGLEASQQPFLWVLRGGSEKHPKIKDPSKGLVVSWSPQLLVLRHASVGGFLTHCGWNSTLESLTCGVPMIGWPYGGDQNINCKYMVDVWRTGVRIVAKNADGSLRMVERGEIEGVVRVLMCSSEGSGMRQRAKELSLRAREAMEEARGNLHELVQQVAPSQDE